MKEEKKQRLNPFMNQVSFYLCRLPGIRQLVRMS